MHILLLQVRSYVCAILILIYSSFSKRMYPELIYFLNKEGEIPQSVKSLLLFHAAARKTRKWHIKCVYCVCWFQKTMKNSTPPPVVRDSLIFLKLRMQQINYEIAWCLLHIHYFWKLFENPQVAAKRSCFQNQTKFSIWIEFYTRFPTIRFRKKKLI